ncbi:hypothetical protein EsDP_00005928 [Epichloe bromicola]|uniref:Uncharacterized protein n=1 Tax=Epichloe bromicola TaxID=79588 RepID=A0ABQ0CW50_9HYPO
MAFIKALLFIGALSSQVRQLNPRWDETFANYSAQGDDASGLEARREGALKVLCGSLGYDWAPASVGSIDGGIYHLSHVPGKPRSNPGPGLCGRVSCSYYSAIWWCNDNNAALELGSFRDIAIGAAAIMNNCRSGFFQGGTMGQAFMPGDWNVIVRDDKVDC